MNGVNVRFRRTGPTMGATLEGPATAAAGHLVLAFDGRIDNREEFGSGVGLSTDHVAALTDEALLLFAYQRLGVDALVNLAGDYAFALWDARERTLLCARDPLGHRSLFYHLSPSRFIAGPTVAAVLAHAEVPRAPNEPVVAEYLVGSMAAGDETLFAGVHRLPAGSWMHVEGTTERRGTTAWIDPGAEIRYRCEEEYAEHLRDLLRVAVRARLRGAPPVGIEASGGLDSSTVAAIARAELGDVSRERLLLLSMVFPGLACDERPFIEACHERWQIPALLVPAGGQDAADTARDRRHLDFPDYPNGAMSLQLRRRAGDAGASVILTGKGGDDWFWGSPYHLADELRHVRVRNAIRQARADSTIIPGTVVGRLLSYGIRPCTPGVVRTALRRVRRVPRVDAPWMAPAFAARTDLAQRLAHVRDVPRFPSLAQTDLFRDATGGWAIHAAEMERRMAGDLGIDLRHPLADLRVARFAMAIPESQRWSGRERKRVLRAAAAGLVPDVVRHRTSKVDFTPVVVQALEAQGGPAFFRELGTADLGWVAAEGLERTCAKMLSDYRAGRPSYVGPAWDLWMISGIERWARAAGFVPAARRSRASA